MTDDQKKRIHNVVIFHLGQCSGLLTKEDTTKEDILDLSRACTETIVKICEEPEEPKSISAR